jgi:hypothetical protein
MAAASPDARERLISAKTARVPAGVGYSLLTFVTSSLKRKT